MSALDNLKINFNIAKTLMVDGRDRYLRATRTMVAIEQIYRKQRTQSKTESSEESVQSLKVAHSKSAAKIANLCRENGTLWVKFAQFLSCRPDILPEEYMVELQHLQNNSKPVAFEKIHPLIIKTWGKNWDETFASFDVVPVATASIAQVHRAVLKDGTQVAIKFQLPNALEMFEQDSQVLKTLANVIDPLIKEVDLIQITDQLMKLTLEEMDFSTEASNMRIFGSYPHMPNIVIPQAYEHLSSDKILVTGWVEGLKLTTYIEKNLGSENILLSRLLKSYIQQITQFGVYHADPHPGNFLVMENESLAILDYGAVATLTTQETQHYSQLLLGLIGDQPENLGELFEQAGFVCERQEVIEQISDVLIGDDYEQLSVTDRISLVIEKMRQNKVIMPDSFVALTRVLVSIGGLIKHYEVDFQWS